MGLALALTLRASVALPHPAALERNLQLQTQALRLSDELRNIRTCYQQWLLGRSTTAQARAEMASSLEKIQRGRPRLFKLTTPQQQAWMSRWLDEQVTESRQLQEQLGHEVRNVDARSLASNWSRSLRHQSDWLRDRHQELPQLLAQARHPDLRSYYQWRASILDTLQREQKLAQALQSAFESEKPPDASWLRYALNLHQELGQVRPPRHCQAAHRFYQERAVALARLTQSARDQLADPSADSGSNLQLDEKAFGELHLRAERASLEALDALLKK